MDNYTSALFGSKDMGVYTPAALIYADYFSQRNRIETRRLNSKGQVCGGDVLLNQTKLSAPSYSTLSKKSSGNVFDEAWQFTIDEDDRPSCIFAMPAQFGNVRGSAGEDSDSLIKASVVREFYDMPTYYYFLIYAGKGASLYLNYDNEYNESRYLSIVKELTLVDDIYPDNVENVLSNGDRTVIPVSQSTGLKTNLPVSLTYPTGMGKFSGRPYDFLNMFRALNGLSDANGVSSLSSVLGGIEGIYNVLPFNLAFLENYIDKWKEIENNHLDDLYFVNLQRLGAVGNEQANSILNVYNYIGGFIASGLPIFTLESFDQMIRYFEGDSWIADNDAPPPSDWSTDWDIYIKGAQRPDIFITMKSSKVDEWLENAEDNTSGINKNDIKVEYRYPYYPVTANLNSPNGMWITTPADTISWLEDRYNDTRETDYVSNCDLNYENFSLYMQGGEFSEGGIQDPLFFDLYSQMEFRINYANKYKSTWCRYKIGVIGSPSVPDFSKMHNEGVQDDDWQDNSTVTLHYDEYPPDYNPYPTPQPTPPMPPPPDDTDPIEIPQGQNGIGLLTTTYKINNAQAEALGRFFWGKDFFQKIKALNTSPLENVVGLTIMPIDISGTTDVIVIGDVDTNINGDKISTIPIYSLGSVKITGRYQSFLDFEPYTTMHLFLPFVGFVRLDPVYVTGKTLSVKYAFDVINGLCNAMLFVDGVYMESHQGQCGVDIPLVASNRAELAIGLATSVAGTAVSSGNAASFAVGMAKDIGDYLTGFHSTRQGGYSPTLAWNETRNSFLVIESPNASYTGTYRHDKGMPCNASHSIGTLSGFTVCDQNVDLSGIAGATEKEKSMLKEILTTGFFA